MTTQPPGRRCAGPRDLLYLTTPGLWPHWPFLPLIRHRGCELDCGVLCDLRGLCDATAQPWTVFFANLLCLPPTVAEFLALPQEGFDSAEEVLAAGWLVD
jgi:hypothetical protein